MNQTAIPEKIPETLETITITNFPSYQPPKPEYRTPVLVEGYLDRFNRNTNESRYQLYLRTNDCVTKTIYIESKEDITKKIEDLINAKVVVHYEPTGEGQTTYRVLEEYRRELPEIEFTDLQTYLRSPKPKTGYRQDVEKRLLCSPGVIRCESRKETIPFSLAKEY